MTDLYTLTIGKRPVMWVAFGMLVALFPSRSEAQLAYPQITQITPSSAYANSEFTLRTTGAGFNQPCCSSTPPGPNSAKVFFNGVNGIAVAATYTRSGDTGMLTALIPADALMSLSGTTVLVTIDWCNDFCFSNPLPFTILAAPPPPPPDCDRNPSVWVQAIGPVMFADYTPRNGQTLKDAADACGFKRFNWRQLVTNLPRPSPFFSRETGYELAVKPPATFLDPPRLGYIGQPVDYSYPFYYDSNDSSDRGLAAHTSTSTLSFSDFPKDACLPTGPLNAYRRLKILSDCGNRTAPEGSYMGFKTALVGVLQDGSPSEPLYVWEWKSTFNGTSGGVSVLKNDLPADSNSGFGGVTITSLNGVPQVLPRVTCEASPASLWPPNGQTVVVAVSGSIASGTQPVKAAAFAVTDEYGLVQPSGKLTISPSGTYSVGIPLIAARNGSDKDGRTYELVIGAQDSIGNMGSCTVMVKVPHDNGK